MDRGIHIIASEGPASRLGRLVLAGEVVDAEPAIPRSLRVIDAYVLSVVLEGHGSYLYPDGRHKVIHPGTVTTVRPGEPHWYGTAPGERWTELYAIFFGPLFDALAATGVVPESGPRKLPLSQSASMLRSILRNAVHAAATAERQMLALAGWLADTNHPPQAEPTPPIAAALTILSSDLAQAKDMRDVAAAVGLSYRTFRRRFTEEVGQAPLTFRNTHRIQCAATLLQTTDLKVKAIARSLGYSDEFHLSRQFRAHFGAAPTDYRRDHRAEG